MPFVLQDWVADLTLMQQAVLMAGVRGPDGIHKDHVSKLLLRWYRRCFIKSAFTGRNMWTPWEDDGGSFTGPSVIGPWPASREPLVPVPFEGEDHQRGMTEIAKRYLRTVDEVPHHFQLHLMHGAEILGYKHPDPDIREWWYKVYCMIANDMHLVTETEARMDYRLGDKESNWRTCEAGIMAMGPDEEDTCDASS